MRGTDSLSDPAKTPVENGGMWFVVIMVVVLGQRTAVALASYTKLLMMTMLTVIVTELIT